MKKIGILLIIFWICGCHNSDQIIQYKNAKVPQGIIYVQEDSLKPKYKNIVFLDLATRERKILIGSEYLNGEPQWSKDGKTLLFASARIGDKQKLTNRAGTYAFSEQIYVLYLSDLTIEMIYNPKSYFYIDQMLWFEAANKIYFSDLKGIKYLNLNNDSLITLMNYDNDNMFMLQMGKSPNERFFVFNTVDQLYVYDVERNQNVYTEERLHDIHIVGWDFTNNLILRMNEDYYSLDVVNKVKKKMNFPFESTYNLVGIFYDSDTTAIAEFVYYKNNSYRNDVARVDLMSGDIDWITKDGSFKYNLNIHL